MFYSYQCQLNNCPDKHSPSLSQILPGVDVASPTPPPPLKFTLGLKACDSSCGHRPASANIKERRKLTSLPRFKTGTSKLGVTVKIQRVRGVPPPHGSLHVCVAVRPARLSGEIRRPACWLEPVPCHAISRSPWGSRTDLYTSHAAPTSAWIITDVAAVLGRCAQSWGFQTVPSLHPRPAPSRPPPVKKRKRKCSLL